jgi:hypothetical protein
VSPTSRSVAESFAYPRASGGSRGDPTSRSVTAQRWRVRRLLVSETGDFRFESWESRGARTSRGQANSRERGTPLSAPDGSSFPLPEGSAVRRPYAGFHADRKPVATGPLARTLCPSSSALSDERCYPRAADGFIGRRVLRRTRANSSGIGQLPHPSRCRRKGRVSALERARADSLFGDRARSAVLRLAAFHSAMRRVPRAPSSEGRIAWACRAGSSDKRSTTPWSIVRSRPMLPRRSSRSEKAATKPRSTSQVLRLTASFFRTREAHPHPVRHSPEGRRRRRDLPAPC